MNNGTHRNPGKWGTDFHTARAQEKYFLLLFFIPHLRSEYGRSIDGANASPFHSKDMCVRVCRRLASDAKSKAFLFFLATFKFIRQKENKTVPQCRIDAIQIMYM